MRNPIVLDTGPLVALLNRRDRYHVWARERWAHLVPPLFTCEAVLAEACFLVHSLHGGQAAVLDLARRGVLDVSFHVAEEADAVHRLVKKYRDVPMSFADGCLVRLAERHAEGVVFTLDSDFTVYRKHGRQIIPTLAPA